MEQLNNAIVLQRCAGDIERETLATGDFPRLARCSDYWGEQVGYFVRDGTFVLVSAGADRQMDARYHLLKPVDIPSASTCLSRGADTVFVGRRAVRYCLK
jgi:hypothetical protein